MMTASGVKFEGSPVQMGDKVLIIPPLTFKQLKDSTIRVLMEKMGNIGTKATDEQLNAARDVITACVARNYPDITSDSMDEMLTMGNLASCMRAIFGIEKSSGEVVATQLPQPTGTNSTAS